MQAHHHYEGVVVSKLVVARLILSGALVAIAIAETFGLTSGSKEQVIAGGFGAATVVFLKIAHVI